MPAPNGGVIRCKVRIDERGQWHEIGEFINPERPPQKFFEMTLQRQR